MLEDVNVKSLSPTLGRKRIKELVQTSKFHWSRFRARCHCASSFGYLGGVGTLSNYLFIRSIYGFFQKQMTSKLVTCNSFPWSKAKILKHQFFAQIWTKIRSKLHTREMHELRFIQIMKFLNSKNPISEPELRTVPTIVIAHNPPSSKRKQPSPLFSYCSCSFLQKATLNLI